MSSVLDSVKSVISTVAPMLGTALGGPLGGLAGGLISKALGGKTNSEITKALQVQDPATMLALKQAEDEFKEHMRQLDVTEEQLQYADVDSARKMETATKDSTPRNLSYIVVLGVAVAIGAVLMGVTHVDSALAGTLIGYMISEAKAVFGFWFGSSRASQAKDETIASIAKE